MPRRRLAVARNNDILAAKILAEVDAGLLQWDGRRLLEDGRLEAGEGGRPPGAATTLAEATVCAIYPGAQKGHNN